MSGAYPGVFAPLILSKSTIKLEERAIGSGKSVVQWKPYQANHSERHPTIEASKTVFNLVPCTNAFERDMALFLDRASDVNAFFRNEYIAHQEKELDDMNTAKGAVDDWIKGLIFILKDE